MSDLSQFIRVESYGRSSPKKAKAGFCQNIQDVINEASREIDSIPHVSNPLPPVLLHGRPLDQVVGACETWAASMTDAKGRALRKDALCLLAGVVSAPAGFQDWPAFRDESIAFLQKKYGDDLECVVEHIDEDQPHIHFYVIPRPGQRFETVHEGRAASDAVKGEKMRASKEVAYNAAMVGFQDRFHADVASRFDFARIGPGAPRVSRAEAVKRKETRKTVEASMMRDVKVAIDTGLKQGRRKGYGEGIERGKADFEKKSIYAKLTEFIAGLKKKNSELSEALSKATKELGSVASKFETLKEKTKAYIDELKKLRPEVTRLRSKNSELTRDNSALQKSLANLDDTKKELSSAKSSIRHLQLVVDSYKKEDQARLDELRKVDKALKNKQKPLSNSLDYS